MVAPAGAGPCPQITSVLPRLTSYTITGTSPPGPLRCGSTTCKVNAVATAAAKALPPFSSVAMPIAVAIQCVEVTTPKVPSISGRLVKGLGLMLDGRGGIVHLVVVTGAEPHSAHSRVSGNPVLISFLYQIWPPGPRFRGDERLGRLPQVTRHHLARFDLAKQWRLHPAALDGVGTAGVEMAA